MSLLFKTKRSTLYHQSLLYSKIVKYYNFIIGDDTERPFLFSPVDGTKISKLIINALSMGRDQLSSEDFIDLHPDPDYKRTD